MKLKKGKEDYRDRGVEKRMLGLETTSTPAYWDKKSYFLLIYWLYDDVSQIIISTVSSWSHHPYLAQCMELSKLFLYSNLNLFTSFSRRSDGGESANSWGRREEKRAKKSAFFSLAFLCAFPNYSSFPHYLTGTPGTGYLFTVISSFKTISLSISQLTC